MKNFSLIAALLICTFSLSSAVAQDKKPYSLNFSASTPAKINSDSTCVLKITPQKAPEEWTLKTNTPFKMKLSSDQSVQLAKAEFTAKDFVDATEADKRINTPFKVTKAGKFDIAADLTFFVCSKSICKRQKAKTKCSIEAK